MWTENWNCINQAKINKKLILQAEREGSSEFCGIFKTHSIARVKIHSTQTNLRQHFVEKIMTDLNTFIV